MREKSFFVKFILLQFTLFIVLFVIFFLASYMSKVKLQNTFAKELKTQGANIVEMYVKSLENSIENIINSYAEWTKMYKKIQEKNVLWLKSTMGEDTQINSQFYSYGIIKSNGNLLYGKNVFFTKKKMREMIAIVSEKYAIGSKMKHPLTFYYRNKNNFYIVGISPICSDTGIVLSHNVMFFAKNINNLAKIVHKLNRLLSAFCETAQLKGLVCRKLKGLDSKPVGYIIIKPSNQFRNYVNEFYSIIIYFALGVLIYFIIAVAAFYIFKKTVYGAYEDMVTCLKGISDMDMSKCDKLDRLSKRNDEIGDMARRIRRIAFMLKSSIIHDPLTRLFNRRYCREALRIGVERAKRYSRPLSVGMIDIDDFKNVNDRYGHLIGDLVLKCLADAIKKGLRSADYVCRVGGEEFVLVMPETDITLAKKVAERIRSFVEEYECKTQSGIVKITISIGVASVKDEDSYIKLLERADQALYKAKEKGKNRVCIES